ncbi:ATP-binding cassette domain-containing protein [Photobacterium jeanii]|uniref:ABC transporter ATP-binding protein n=1 Tax=Photobacterium jeanii TaxID=858640 RepID=UPI00082C1C79|nr:ABC transporter ATP-binding protein [Photobacterium jeanii]PST90283.1 ABC transporter [Photobacterium jeanii]
MALVIDNLTSGFEASAILAPSFQLSAPQHLAISGPSGCGKSSLLRILAGLAAPKSGQFRWQDTVITADNIRWWRQQICYLPQQAVMGGETIFNVLCLPWTMQAMQSQAPSEAECLHALEKVGLRHGLDKDVEPLSGGEKQRLAIARAILMKRPVWLLDEPTSALDLASRDRVIALLADLEVIKISVSHDPHWLIHCDHVYDMQQINSEPDTQKKEISDNRDTKSGEASQQGTSRRAGGLS